MDYTRNHGPESVSKNRKTESTKTEKAEVQNKHEAANRQVKKNIKRHKINGLAANHVIHELKNKISNASENFSLLQS